MESKLIFGQMIDYYRKQHNMTLEELGDKLGKSKSSISRWINNERYPKMEEVEKIAEFFNTDIQTLLFGSETELDDILYVYNKLTKSRKQKVFSYAEMELKKQETTTIDEDKIYELYPKSIINGRKSAAGYAIEADDYDAEVISESMVPHGADELVEIVGDSMEPLIQKGSDVYIRHQPSVENGEVAIVRIENEGVTCKRFYYKDDSKTIILKSENEKYEDMFFDPSQVTVLGKVLL